MLDEIQRQPGELEMVEYIAALSMKAYAVSQTIFTVKARRNTYGSYQLLPWGTSREL
jgi:hypothetical protein